MHLSRLIILLMSTTLFFSCGAGNKSLDVEPPHAEEGEPFPPFIGISVKGRTIDNTIFNDHITLVSAWRLGCKWSMLEIHEYNQLLKEVQDERFQIISLAPHTKEELEALYGGDQSMLGRLKEITDAPIAVPEYDALPMCSLKRYEHPDSITAQCDAIRDLLDVNEFPVTFIVGPNGVIRHRHDGLIVDQQTMQPDISEFRADLDSLLRVL